MNPLWQAFPTPLAPWLITKGPLPSYPFIVRILVQWTLSIWIWEIIIWNSLLIWGEEWLRDSEPINIYLRAGTFNQIFFIQLSKTNQKANQFCNLESWWYSNFAFCAFKSALFSFLWSADSKNQETTAASRLHLQWAKLTGEIDDTILAGAQRWNASRMRNENFVEITKTQWSEWHRSVWWFERIMSSTGSVWTCGPQVGDAVWGGCGTFRKWSFTGTNIPGFEVYGLDPFSVLFYCFLYVDDNVTSRLPDPAAGVPKCCRCVPF